MNIKTVSLETMFTTFHPDHSVWPSFHG